MTEQSISEQSSHESPKSEGDGQLEVRETVEAVDSEVKIETSPRLEPEDQQCELQDQQSSEPEQERLELDLQVLDRLSQTEKWLAQPIFSESVQEYFSDLLFILAQVQPRSELSGDQLLFITANLESIQRSYRFLELEQSRQKERDQSSSSSSLWQDYQNLKLERDELSADRSQLLSEIAQLKRDKTATYVISASGTSHHHELVQRFVHFREQDLKAIANEIFWLKFQGLQSPTRKQNVAKIRSVLSSEIFVQSDFIQGAISKICNELQIDESLFKAPDSQLYQTVKAGFRLRLQMEIADPPAQILIEPIGTPFNPERHESIPGCDDTDILFTVHPSYLVGDRVMTKALVFTSPETVHKHHLDL